MDRTIIVLIATLSLFHPSRLNDSRATSEKKKEKETIDYLSPSINTLELVDFLSGEDSRRRNKCPLKIRRNGNSRALRSRLSDAQKPSDGFHEREREREREQERKRERERRVVRRRETVTRAAVESGTREEGLK